MFDLTLHIPESKARDSEELLRIRECNDTTQVILNCKLAAALHRAEMPQRAIRRCCDEMAKRVTPRAARIARTIQRAPLPEAALEKIFKDLSNSVSQSGPEWRADS